MSLQSIMRQQIAKKTRSFNNKTLKEERLFQLTPVLTVEDKISYIVLGKLFKDIHSQQRILINYLLNKALEGCETAQNIFKDQLELDEGLRGLL